MRWRICPPNIEGTVRQTIIKVNVACERAEGVPESQMTQLFGASGEEVNQIIYFVRCRRQRA